MSYPAAVERIDFSPDRYVPLENGEWQLINYQARRIAIVNFTGFRQNWGCQATSWGLVHLLNRALDAETLPYLALVPLIIRHEIDRQIEQKSMQDIYDAIMNVCVGGPSARKSLKYLEKLTVERYGKYAGQTKNSDLVVFQAEGTMTGTDFVRGARLLLLPFVAKHAWKKPVIAVNQTIFSCDTAFTECLVAAYNTFDLVAVRENISFDAARNAGIKNVIHIPDAAFFTRPMAGPIDISAGRHFAISDTAWSGSETPHELFAIANRLKQETGLIPLIAVSTQEGKQLIDLARTYWGNDGFATVSSQLPYTVLAHTLQNCCFLLSGRYHMAIMAASVGTPVIQIPGNSYKNEGFSAMLGGLSPVRRFNDHNAIAKDAKEFMDSPHRAATDLREALKPVNARLQIAGDYFAAIQKGHSVKVPQLFKTLPGKSVSANAYISSYCINAMQHLSKLKYSDNIEDRIGAGPRARSIFAAHVAAYHAGDFTEQNSLLQMLRSFPGKVDSAHRNFRKEILRLPVEFLAIAGVPRPTDPKCKITNLSELQRNCGTCTKQMRRRIVSGNFIAPSRRKAANIGSQIATVREEFASKPEILFYHAALISLLRREIDVSEAYVCFEILWKNETEFLREQLDSRWLIAACDTFSDHAQDPVIRTLAMTGSLFFNTIKLYETENWATGRRGQELNYRAVTPHTQLYDGTSAFLIGSGDLIFNMQKRFTSILDRSEPIATIVSELFRRMHMHDTVFSRFRDEHHATHTLWKAIL